MEMVKVGKSQNVDFLLWIVKFWPTLYSSMIWISEKMNVGSCSGDRN